MIPPTANCIHSLASDWMNLARSHDAALYHHSVVVSGLCATFSAFLDYPRAERHILTRAGLLHDIGKVKIPASILRKPLPLTAEELAIVQTHAQVGYELLLGAGEKGETLLSVVRDHHERLDGTGYPQRLTANQISLSVRLVTLCDVFAAMTEPRPYAEVMRWDEALERMGAKRTRLDLDLLSEFATMMRAMNVPKKRSRLFEFGQRRAS